MGRRSILIILRHLFKGGNRRLPIALFQKDDFFQPLPLLRQFALHLPDGR